MISCNFCKHSNHENAAFCEKCGNSLYQRQSSTNFFDASSYTDFDGYYIPKKKRAGLFIGLGAGVVAIAAAIVMLFVFFHNAGEMVSKAGKNKKDTASVSVSTDTSASVSINTPQVAVKQIKDYCNVDFNQVFDMSGAGIADNNPNGYMAHNIYANPDLNGTSGKYSGFLIDFKADYSAEYTYWALCNFNMDLSDLRKRYGSASGGYAYCGLQRNEGNTRSAIMSFWQVEYDGKIQNAILIYPEGESNGYFGNEGSGANYITPHKWDDDKWYRMYIGCYDDPATDHTIVEMWVKDISVNAWEKICAYDTNLINSCFVGEMSQFMENYLYISSNELRTCEYANYYVREYESGEWKYIENIKLSIDTGYGNKKGSFAIGSTENTVWGITCGYGSDVADLNEDIHSYEHVDCAVLDCPDYPY